MKLKQLMESNMSVEEIESTIDDIMNEMGHDSTVKKMVKQITNFLTKKDLSGASVATEKLMDYVRDHNAKEGFNGQKGEIK